MTASVQWLSVSELARVLGKSVWSVYKMRREGTIPFVKRGGRLWTKVDADRIFVP